MKKFYPASYGKAGLLLLFSVWSLITYAQMGINGTVKNAKDGNAVSNATVSLKGSTTSVKTNADGMFSINISSAKSVLLISCVGYQTQQVTANSANLTINLLQVDAQLQEVVVVAYGTRRKTDLTGSVVSIGTKDFQKGTINSSEQLLQGKVAGLEVTTGGGSAGGGSKIRIRGGASLTASNDPLVVIDGVPIDGNGVAGSPNYLSTINPNDIESISVLKDASATSLYGSRASNGVLIITTKKGVSGKTVFNFNTKYSLSKVEDFISVLSGDEVRTLINAEAAKSGSSDFKSKLGNDNTNWQKVIYQNAQGLDNNLSASGTFTAGSKIKLPFRVSGGSLTQEGVLKTNKFDRLSGAINLSPKFLDEHLAVNFSLRLVNTKTRFANEGAVGAAVSMNPTVPVYSGQKNWGGYYETLQADGKPFDLATRNPLALLEQQDNRGNTTRLLSNIQLDYKFNFLPDLHVLGNFGIDNANGKSNSRVDSNAATSYQKLGRVSTYNESKRNLLADVSLFYSKDLKNIKSKVDLLVGHTYQDFYTNTHNYAVYGVDGKIDSTTIPTFVTDKPQYRIESYLSRLNYSYDDKYLLTASIRRDATSKFSKENRVGYFPAVAVAWKLKNDFFKNTQFINELKLRGGYGITGQQDGISYYSYLPIYNRSSTTAQYQFGDNYYSFLRPSAYDKNLKWETTATSNIGLDFGFLNNRISGSVEVYEKKTKDLLSIINIAPGSNFNIELLTNVGNITNRGIEASLNLVPVKLDNFSWDLNVNGSYNKTKITNLLKNTDPTFKGVTTSGISGGTGNNVGKHAVGYAPYSYFLFKQVYDASTGKPLEGLYADLNRDGIIDDNDRYLSKKPAPDFLFGFSTQFNIYKFYVGMAAHGMLGNYLYNNFNSNMGTLSSVQNTLGFIGNASTNYNNTKFKTPNYLSDYYLENASFLRIDNINAGYNFGKIKNSKAVLRLNASVQNVFVITKYSGADPENANSTGVDNNIYPRPRIYTIGASIDF